MMVMFFAKIHVIVHFKHEQFIACLREAVCYTYNWGHLQELCLYLGVDIEFVFCLVSVFLMFYKMNKRKKMLHTML